MNNNDNINNENMNEEIINKEVINEEETVTDEAMADESITEEHKSHKDVVKVVVIIAVIFLVVAALTVGAVFLLKDYIKLGFTDNESKTSVYTEEYYTEETENVDNVNTTHKSQPSGSDNNKSNENNSSTNTSNNSSKTPTATTSSNKSSETQISSNKSLAPTVTISAQVANNICIVGGNCSKNTEYITISGDGVETTSVTPYEGGNLNYFLTQVKYSKATELNITAYETGKDTSNAVTKKIKKFSMSDNYMTESEYDAVVGKDSRIHYYSALLSYSLSAKKVPEYMLSTAYSNISEIVSVANSVGAETIFYIIPSSADIYPETVPDGYQEPSGDRIYDLFSAMATDCGATVIYPLETMKSHANDGVGYQIYQHTDSHWSTYGAYWGTYDLFRHISNKFPAAAPRTVSEMGFYTAELYGGDAFFNFPRNIGFEDSIGSGVTSVTKMKELTTLYSLKMPTSTLGQVYHGNTALYLTTDNEPAAVVTNTSNSGLPKAVIMRDSFSKIAYDMVNDRFSEVRWGTFNNYNIPYDDIYSGKPDYVIYFYSERNLLKVMTGTNSTKITQIG